jgi:hypothetical protein
VAIGRAIHSDAEETERVLQIIERLKEQGLTVLEP